MSTESPTGPTLATGWTTRRLRSAAEDVRVRVDASVLALRCGAPTAPEDLDDIRLDLDAVVRGLDAAGADRSRTDDALAIRDASVAVQTAHDLVAGLLLDLRTAER